MTALREPSTPFSNLKRTVSEELVGDAGEDDLGFEEEEAFEVEGALVVEETVDATDDEFGHHDHRHCFWISGGIAKVGEKGASEVSVGGFDDFEGDVDVVPVPVGFHAPCVLGIVGEVEGVRVAEAEGFRVAEGPEGDGADTGDGNDAAGDFGLDVFLLVADDARDVGDDKPGFGE